MSAPAHRLIVDVDTGIDDSLALLYLLASPEAEIAGIASTAGNVPVEQVAANNLNWLALCGAPDIEVALGARVPLDCPLRTTEDTHGPQGIGYAVLPPSGRSLSERDATTLWVDLARAHPGGLTGLVTGPLTNLALAIREEPALPRLLRRLVVMGGAFNHPGNTTPTSEWNVSVDPEAAKEVFDAFSGLPAGRRPILCGLDVTETIEMTPDHVRRLAEAAGSTPAEIISPDDGPQVRSTASNPVIRHLSDAIRFYMDFHRTHDQGFLAHMHDPFAAAVALNPATTRTRPATVDVELHGRLTRGTTVADWVGHWNREPNVDIAVSTDPAAFFDDLVDRVGRFAKSVG
ncbi:purine nucleosidase [Rhodococcus wratislaviensis]|uniref:Purine nucleosidase n=1 Tax=Rhodococcus wratislaviensis TaxID=44752 RepID=A0AB38FGU4_RHOWR|nr:nucleoside hydrolase [Rhodococcus wratislaviensis]REE71205.1 purine nucleosidase [Rhodococcus wratislaviensis]SPZ40711.1 purine nucleosidase [Rhodococcus wratislaviensis]